MKFSFLKNWVSPWRAYLAEFLGTFVFVFISCGAVLSYIFYGEIGVVGAAVATGLAYCAMMYATVHISGGHINPAITLASWLAQKTSGATAVFYVCAQIVAGIAAAGLLVYIFGQEAGEFSLGGPTVFSDIETSRALIVEVALAATVVFAYFATMVDRRGPTSFGPLVMGLMISAATLMALPISGASLNPARAVGPAVVSQVYDSLAVAVVGPLTGSLVGIIYDWLFLKKKR